MIKIEDESDEDERDEQYTKENIRQHVEEDDEDEEEVTSPDEGTIQDEE